MKEPGFAAFIPLIIMTIPVIILNITIAIRKGKNPAVYGVISVIPMIGFFLCLYLASLTDKAINEKIEKIINILESRQ